MKKKLMELSGISDLEDLESIIRDVSPEQSKKEDLGTSKVIQGFLKKPGVFDEDVFNSVWNLFLNEYPRIQSFYEETEDESRSILKSGAIRNKGNEAYLKKRLQKAVDLYSDAIR
ncbi:Uncharacterized protein FKW44_013661, partial [Caligus rogercresseyi]